MGFHVRAVPWLRSHLTSQNNDVRCEANNKIWFACTLVATTAAGTGTCTYGAVRDGECGDQHHLRSVKNRAHSRHVNEKPCFVLRAFSLCTGLTDCGMAAGLMVEW